MSKRLAALALCVLIADQASKWWALRTLSQPPSDVAVLPGFLHLSLAFNSGGAFGLLPHLRALFVLGGALVLLLLLWALRRRIPDRRVRVTLALWLAGTMGNLVDRIRLGYVVDFIDIRYHGRGVWPTFNLADVGITVGGVFLALAIIAKPASENAPP